MTGRNFIFRETGRLLLGQLLCCAAMNGVFALLGYWDLSVLLGSIVGGLLSTANFFAMAVIADLAADKAEAQDVAGGQALLKGSYLGRTVVLFVILFAFAKSGLCNVFALVIPLVFNQPIITFGEFFRKKGDKTA